MMENTAQTHRHPPESGLSDSAKDTRQRLLDAAIEEFCTYGRKGANTARIVGAAQCNIRMIYHYFGNKDGLYREALLQVYARLRAAESQQDFWSGTPTAGVLALTRFTFDYMHQNREFPLMILAENLAGGATVTGIREPYEGSRTLITNLNNLIQQGHLNGEFRKQPSAIDLYLTILALSFIHISNQHTLKTTFGAELGSKAFIDQRRQHAVDVVMGYLGVF